MIGEILTFPVHGDKTGSLVALEKGADFPFEIKRVYYVWGASYDFVRGHHAHKNLEQVIVCTPGSCDFILDDGTKRETYHLDPPTKGLHIKNNVWREFTHFSPRLRRDGSRERALQRGRLHPRLRRVFEEQEVLTWSYEAI